MNKYFGQIGFVETAEIPEGSGIMKEVVTEHDYYGEILQNRQQWGADSKVNENIEISNRISILSDAYACEHLDNIRYATWLGNRWKVKSVEVQYPRLVLEIGGVYHAQPA